MSGTEGDPRRYYHDEDFLAGVAANAPASTSEVAEEVGCTRRNADYRLRQLADQGRVERKKIAATQVWTPGEDGD